jgi:hypothetical protein
MKTLEQLFGFKYAGGGYFRQKGIKKGDTAEILHGMEAIAYLYDQFKKDKELTMTLDEKRAERESGGKTIICVTHNIDGYKTVYVVTSFRKEMNPTWYQLHRYFKLGGNWEVSCDISGGGQFTLDACMKELTTCFKDLLPLGKV